MADGYRIRQYEPADRPAVLSLYERVFDRTDESWFDWRYVDNPYAESVPIAVAVDDAGAGGGGRGGGSDGGQVVAVRPSLALRFAVGDASLPGVMQVDPMVHPDHRRQGLFTRLVEHVYDHYATREPAVSIGFPNEAVAGALQDVAERLSIDAGVVTPFVPCYRIQRPGTLAATGTDRRSLEALGWLATPATRAFLAARRRRAAVDADGDVTVRHDETTPTDVLASLAGDPRADRVRAERDETFYDWRFANPRFDYSSYVAWRDDEPVAAVVCGRPANEPQLLHLSEVLPLRSSAGQDAAGVDHGTGRDGPLLRALEAAFDDNRDAAAVVTAGSALPDRLREAAGFVPVSRPPLSMLTDPTTFVARPLTEGRVDEWRHGGLDLSSPENWGLTMCEREIG